MKPNRTGSAAIIIVSLLIAGIIVCWGDGFDCRSLFHPRNCVVEHMRKMDLSFKKGDLNKAHGKGEADPCSGTKRDVFVDWRKLYWGNLGELTKPERFLKPHNPVQTAGVDSGLNGLTRKGEALKHFTHELRSALKVFEKRYCLKIHWRKKDLTMPDVTAQFIGFWDKGSGQGKGRDSEEKMDTGGK